MAHFRDAFWSSDYAGGLGVLFGKLQQGVQENSQVLTIARMRADAEELYAQHIGDIGPATDRVSDGFQRDDGASVRKAYEGVRVEMDEASQKHYKIASNIRELVVYPFGRWSDQHAARVQNSQDDLQGRVKAHDKQADVVRKLRSHYFNKCRQVEDLEEEDKIAFKDPQSDTTSSPVAASTSTASPPTVKTPTVKILEPEPDDPEPIDIGDAVYMPDQVKKILTHMLENISTTETKVPILGTYYNVSTGSDIVEYIQKHMNATNMVYAERIGQDLIGHGFLRLVGNVGNTFANSSRMYYQWRPKVFQITGLPERRKPFDRSSTLMSMDSMESPVNAVGEYLANWNPLNNPHPNETPAQKLRREAREADEKYKAAVRKLDLLRCTLEEAMIEHFKFMERCELDRLKAIKSVILDFSGALSNVIPSLQSTVDKMMLFQETVQPLSDLRYLLENYRTGTYTPKVQIYENYYNSVDDQTFGVDLEARARADRKRVPVIVTSILMFLDDRYPLLDGDEARQAIWLVDVPLAATHRLRDELNNGKIPPAEVLDRYEVPIVASVLRLYLLELPDSLVSSTLYEIIKTIYSSAATSGSDEESSSTRVSVLQNTLGQLRLVNIATLDAITTHFARLLDLTSADEQYTATLTQSLAPCILRPRNETSLSFEEKYSYRFTRDLLQFKDVIFNELKRAASQSNASRLPARTPSTDSRPRGQSYDESNRRANMEERARAIVHRSRASSPANLKEQHREGLPQTLQQQRHRRDSSKGPSETRFPINVSSSTVRPDALGSPGTPDTPFTHASRVTLDVPGSAENSPIRERTAATAATVTPPVTIPEAPVNGQAETAAIATAPVPAPTSTPTISNSIEPDATSSLGRSGRVGRKSGSLTGIARQAGARRSEGTSNPDGATSAPSEERRPVGVELTDTPMDD